MEKGLSIVMPCLNEEKTIGICIDKAKNFLKKAGLSGEIIIADNEQRMTVGRQTRRITAVQMIQP